MSTTQEPRVLSKWVVLTLLQHVAHRMAAQRCRYEVAARCESAATTASQIAPPEVGASELIGLFKLLGVKPEHLADLLRGNSPYRGPNADQDWAPMLEQLDVALKQRRERR